MFSPSNLVLVLNSGSSSLKFAVHDTSGRIPLLSGPDDRSGILSYDEITYVHVAGLAWVACPERAWHAAELRP